MTVITKPPAIATMWAEYLEITRWIIDNTSEESEAAYNAVCSRHSEIERSILAHPDTTPFATAAKLHVMRMIIDDEDIEGCLGGLLDATSPDVIEIPAFAREIGKRYVLAV